MQIGSAGAFAGTAGTIHDNTITDIGFNDPTTVNPNTGGATGILVYHGSSGLEIADNQVSGYAPFSTNPNYANSGITFLDSDGGNVHGNTISGFDNALTDQDVFGGVQTTVLAHANNTFTNNATNVVLEPLRGRHRWSPSAGRRATTISPARRAATRSPGLAAPTRSPAVPATTRSTAGPAPTRWPAAPATTPTSSTMPAT